MSGIEFNDVDICTPRLRIRMWGQADLEDIYEYASKEGVGEMAGWKHHESKEESQRILDAFIKGKNVLALEYRANGKAIGSIGLHPSWVQKYKVYAHLKAMEVGYVLSMDYWGQGLMTEALKAVARYCFDEMGLDALSCAHFLHNNRSRGVIEKCGFQYIKNGFYYANGLDRHFEEKKYLLIKDGMSAAAFDGERVQD